MGFSTFSTGFSTERYVYLMAAAMQKTGDITPVKGKNKVEMNKKFLQDLNQTMSKRTGRTGGGATI